MKQFAFPPSCHTIFLQVESLSMRHIICNHLKGIAFAPPSSSRLLLRAEGLNNPVNVIDRAEPYSLVALQGMYRIHVIFDST